MPFLEAESKGFGKDFEAAHPLWNAEVCFILDKYLESHNNQRNSPQNSMIQRTLEYVRKLNNYSTAQLSQAARELMKTGNKFTDYESALINNLNICSVDEAVTLIPSLKDKFPNTDELSTKLAQLQDFQKSSDENNYNITSYAALTQNYHNTQLEQKEDVVMVEPTEMNDPQPQATQNPADVAMGASPVNYSQTPVSE
mmetsp:Transcript_28594/g.46920  ORF Transcript_28594/g.46920 Transcript_28594/m.46920 type:complete len:198 (-) Transcript_28594:491-1084(-)|eukprot:CAMPEP_0202700408 /NCGR_PEP_ID=MMETSP1385-20130828/13585_1 /ASSEMBLY_ACC=CAM_ASM_000861 /TAXON_ID=933848 /ORGANISM="Elphidium margaritaceum" /LENGTH=197 /DNA_ID=CAMNT_0049357583 /DNA_START=40 /DNA_END=633 /DNA_ORIENTATION=-